MALLRVRALPGCSRQLASLKEALAPNRNTQDSPAAQLPHSSLMTPSSACNLAGVQGQLVCLLCQVHTCVPRLHRQDDTDSVEQEGVRMDAEELVGKQQGDEQQKHHGTGDGGWERGEMGKGGIQLQEVHARRATQAGRHDDLLQEVLSGMILSAVLEQLSQCVLLLAGPLQGAGEAGEGQVQRERRGAAAAALPSALGRMQRDVL